MNKVSGVVHVGANSGQERNVYRDLGLRTVWVEAIPEVYDRLVVTLQGYPHQTAFKALLTDTDGTGHELHVANNAGASSSIFELGDCLDIWPRLLHGKPHPQEHAPRYIDGSGKRLTVALPGSGDGRSGRRTSGDEGLRKRLGQFRFEKAEAADFES